MYFMYEYGFVLIIYRLVMFLVSSYVKEGVLYVMASSVKVLEICILYDTAVRRSGCNLAFGRGLISQLIGLCRYIWRA